jgi:hypothetical protein
MAEKEPEVAALLARSYIGMSKSLSTQARGARGREREAEREES